MDNQRIQSFEEFWPYYLSEHRNPASRRLHFLGTNGWLATLAGSLVVNPIGFGAALAAFGGLMAHGVKKGESETPRLGHIAGMIGLSTLASPILFPAGVVFAYGCAWIGHFRIENNRPATFTYPLWSLAGDLRMWSHMVRGKLWNGDPFEELGLDDPGLTPDAEAPMTTIHA